MGEMHQTKKGNQWYFGMKVHIGVDKDTGLIHSVETTAANVHDLTPAAELLHVRRLLSTPTPATKGSKSDPKWKETASASVLPCVLESDGLCPIYPRGDWMI